LTHLGLRTLRSFDASHFSLTNRSESARLPVLVDAFPCEASCDDAN
jgi:hypothetical protein